MAEGLICPTHCAAQRRIRGAHAARSTRFRSLLPQSTVRDGAAVARRAHNPKVVGSNPTPATTTPLREPSPQSSALRRPSPIPPFPLPSCPAFPSHSTRPLSGPSPLPGGRLGGGWAAANTHYPPSAPPLSPNPIPAPPIRHPRAPPHHSRAPSVIPAQAGTHPPPHPFLPRIHSRPIPPALPHSPPPFLGSSPLPGGRLGGG